MEERRPQIGSAVLVGHGGKFLLGERSKQNYNGYWVIPGGRPEFGETLEQAGIREMKEETGLDVEIVRFLCHKEIINVPGDYHRVVFYHLARLKEPGQEIRAGDDLSRAGFFPIEEIKGMRIAESVEWVLRKAGFWR
jgi:8-oxo-dGTP diphosphatase